MRRRRRLGIRSVLPCLAIAVAVACSRPEGAPNVVIVAIDTLRADHLGCYGYPRPTSPRIDALAAEGVVFGQAIAQSPWTLPSFASIFTGVIPQRHGAGQGKLCLNRPCGGLAPEQATLAESMARAGYRTASFVSNGFVGPDVGLGRGFEVAESIFSGSAVVAKAVDWLRAHRTERLFLFAHLIEPHLPYEPPAEDAAPFIDPAYAGSLGLRVHDEWSQRALDDADRRRIVDLYDGEIHVADRLVGQLLDELARLGIDRHTLVILVADHGEELLERGTLGHGHTLYDELVRVPLVVRFPDREPRGRVDRQVRAMDVFPTVLEVAGIDVPAGLHAVSLVGLARGEAAPAATDSAIAEFTFSGPELRGLRTAAQKVIVDQDRHKAALFDLLADPKETTDLASSLPDRIRAMRATLEATEVRGEPGLYIMLRGGTRTERFQATLEEPLRGFAGAHPLTLENGDRATIESSGRVATIDCTVEPGEIDGVRLSLPVAAPAIRLTALTVDGAPLPGTALFMGTRPLSLVPAAFAPSSAAVPRASPPPKRQSLAIAIQWIAPTTAQSLQLGPKTIEGLRALGYMQ